MAASVTIVITSTNDTIAQLNSDLSLVNVGRHDLCNLIINLLAKASISALSPGTLQVTTTDVAPTISTSGAGSLQVSKLL
jgi:hypothetical protein